MVLERRVKILEGKREQAQVLLGTIEGGDVSKVQEAYHQAAQLLKPLIAERARWLATLGAFPEEEVIGDQTIPLLDIGYQTGSSLNKVVIDSEGNMFICRESRNHRDSNFIIDWGSRQELSDYDYVDFALPSLHAIVSKLREALGIRGETPVPDKRRF